MGPEGRLVESCRYDWAEEGLATLSDDERYQSMPLSDEDRSGELGDWARRRERGEVVQATLREVRGYAREVFLEHGTLSFASVPIMVGGRFWGFLGFDDCKTERIWNPLEIEVLKTAAALLAGAISRAQAHEQLLLSEERYKMAALGANDGLWDWDLSSGKAYLSPRLHELLHLEEGALGGEMESLLQILDPADAWPCRTISPGASPAESRSSSSNATSRSPSAGRSGSSSAGSSSIATTIPRASSGACATSPTARRLRLCSSRPSASAPTLRATSRPTWSTS